MRNFFITIFLIIVGCKFSYDYITSNDFQDYGDRTNASWTCPVTLYVGHFYLLLDQPSKAKTYYDRIPSRCPDFLTASEAAYYSAYTLDTPDALPQNALAAYENFLVNYSTSPRAVDANKNINRIKGARSL